MLPKRIYISFWPPADYQTPVESVRESLTTSYQSPHQRQKKSRFKFVDHVGPAARARVGCFVRREDSHLPSTKKRLRTKAAYHVKWLRGCVDPGFWPVAATTPVYRPVLIAAAEQSYRYFFVSPEGTHSSSPQQSTKARASESERKPRSSSTSRLYYQSSFPPARARWALPMPCFMRRVTSPHTHLVN